MCGAQQFFRIRTLSSLEPGWETSSDSERCHSPSIRFLSPERDHPSIRHFPVVLTFGSPFRNLYCQVTNRTAIQQKPPTRGGLVRSTMGTESHSPGCIPRSFYRDFPRPDHSPSGGEANSPAHDSSLFSLRPCRFVHGIHRLLYSAPYTPLSRYTGAWTPRFGRTCRTDRSLTRAVNSRYCDPAGLFQVGPPANLCDGMAEYPHRGGNSCSGGDRD